MGWSEREREKVRTSLIYIETVEGVFTKEKETEKDREKGFDCC